MRIDQPDRLERPEGQRHAAAPGQNFDGQTALEHQLFLEIVNLRRLRRDERVVKGVVFLLGHRAVNVIIALAAAIARGLERAGHVDRFRRHDGRLRVEKVQALHAGQLLDRARQRAVGQRACGDDAGRIRDLGHGLVNHLAERMATERFGHDLRKPLAIDRQRAAGRNARFLSRVQDQRIKELHLGLEQPRGVGQMLGLERIGTHQLGKAARHMSGRGLFRAHFDQLDRNAAPQELPGRLAAGQPRPHDGYAFIIHHSRRFLRRSPPQHGGGTARSRRRARPRPCGRALRPCARRRRDTCRPPAAPS